MRWPILLLGPAFPALLAPKRLLVGVAGAWMLWGNGIVLGYYYGVVKRNTPVGV